MEMLQVVGPRVPGIDTVLTGSALWFLEGLIKEFADQHAVLMIRRRRRHENFRTTINTPRFLWETEHIRKGTWQVAKAPQDLQCRKVEITAPASNPKMVINALNSDADVFMADAEDSESPTWANLIAGQLNLRQAVQRTITLETPDKKYQLKEKPAVLMFRPRGWHLYEKHILWNGVPVPAALVDFGLYFCHNAHRLISSGSGPYFYLPKMESYLEARLWNDVFAWAQSTFAIPYGTIRATLLCETLPAAFELEEMLYELRDHSAGANCGRWDYIFSYIKLLGRHFRHILPDRSQLTMDKAFLAAYARHLIQVCHLRGAHAIGGMSAYIPVKDQEANEVALGKVHNDKLREATLGHDGTWVAHPGLVTTARRVFDQFIDGPHQISVIPSGLVTEQDLLDPHQGTITYEGLRSNLQIALQYLTAWLGGVGCVPMNNLMEDAATAEISRVQVWQWLHHGVQLHDGRRVTRKLVQDTLAEFVTGQNYQAATLLSRLVTVRDCPEFLTIHAYGRLVGLEE